MNKIRKILSIIITIAIVFSLPGAVFAADTLRFGDVPETHFAFQAISDMRRLGITGGIGNNQFGMGRTVTRGEFITFLIKLTGWDPIAPEQGSFNDNTDKNNYYYTPIETALQHGVIIRDSEYFRVDDAVTREEMAVMIVRALGYDSLAGQVANLAGFSDVTINKGYITIARDFGIMSGTGNNTFGPDLPATREAAAYMLMKMYERMNRTINEVHAFYAISSYSQVDMIPSMDSAGFGWSRLEFDAASNQVILNTSYSNGNEYGFPVGFSETLNRAKDNGIPAQLMVAVKDEAITDPTTGGIVPLVEYAIGSPEVRSRIIQSIVQQINASTIDGVTVSFDGAVIDFENLKGESTKEYFNEFLKELKQQLAACNKTLIVAVQPAREPGQEYYDGYDFKAIGEIADKVILMAHDYYAKHLTDSEMKAGYTLTPPTPFDEVYYALKAITDKNTGVQDVSKILLQISFDPVQWQKKVGEVINKTPYHPSYEALQKRLSMDGVTIAYSNTIQNPYAKYADSTDGTDNIIWYEDSRSVEAKMKLASMFGVEGISIWRLGNIPDYEDAGKPLYMDVWQQIQSLTGK